MKRSLTLVSRCLLGGCVVGTVAKTAVDVVTLPVKVVSAGVDAVTTSQTEADEKRGREIRKQEEERGKQLRLAAERCRKGQPLPDRRLRRGGPALRYFLDTEYNGWGGALLSLALVPDDGEELYLTLDWDGPLEAGSSATSSPISIRFPKHWSSPRLSRADAARDDRPLSRRRSRAADRRRLARGHRAVQRAAGDRARDDGRGSARSTSASCR